MFYLVLGEFLVGLGAGLFFSAAQSQGVQIQSPMDWYWKRR